MLRSNHFLLHPPKSLHIQVDIRYQGFDDARHKSAHEKVTTLRHALIDLKKRIMNLTESILLHYKIKGQPDSADMVVLVNDYLKRRTCCRISLLDMQNLPCVDFRTAFAYVFDVEAIRKYVSSKRLAEETQEVEEREKVVKHMWDVYTHSKKSQLPRFWRRAFEAAYEDLVSDVSTIRNAALLEIARMSLISLDLILEYSVPQSTTSYETDSTHIKLSMPSKLHK